MIIRRVTTAAAMTVISIACAPPSTAPAPIPTPPPANVPPQRLTAEISGSVTDAAFRALAGASIEIGDDSGSVASFVVEGPSFSYSGAFLGAITIRATRDGYVPVTRRVVPSQSQRVFRESLVLESINSAAIELGAYTFTVTADSSCAALPADFRTTSYPASIMRNRWLPTPSHYTAEVAGTVHWLGGTGVFDIGVAGDYVAITDDTSPQLNQDFPGFRRFEIGIGGHFVAPGPSVSTLSFPAYVTYCEFKSDRAGWFCEAAKNYTPENLRSLVRCSARAVLTR